MAVCICSGVCIQGSFIGPGLLPCVEFLMVAGGGGGGRGGGDADLFARTGGGGGAGGFCCGTVIPPANVSYNIIVGSGGAAQTNGQRTCFDFRVVCGGGYGGTKYGAGGCGGSGGGGAGWNYAGGNGIPGQGFCGGGGCEYPGSDSRFESNAGGGGGHCVMGGTIKGRFTPNTLCGGNGSTHPVNQGIAYGELCGGCYYVGGGGGGSVGPGNSGCSAGGLGGGGKGGSGNNPVICPGVAGTGGGGGGQFCCLTVGSGGSGVVILRYDSSLPDSCTTGSPCYCCTGGYKYYVFTGSGSIRFCQ